MSTERAMASDARAITRGVLVNALGYAAKVALPFLLAFATQAYGASRWGVFVTLQALVTVVGRVAMVGLDKAILWWVASKTPQEGKRDVLPVALYAASLAAVVAIALALFGERVLVLWDANPIHVASLRAMALAMPALAACDVFLHAMMGARRMEPQVAIRDTAIPIAQLAVALVLASLGRLETGLAWSYVASSWIGLGLATVVYGRSFGGGAKLGKPPRPLLDYALPMWLTESANSLLLRMDTLALAALTHDEALVGVWGVVSQLGNAIRSVRRAFDPIVTAVSAGIAREHDPARLRAVVSYAAQLVSTTQLPIFAFLLAFADVLLPLYGEGFGRGAAPVLVLCAFWLVNGAMGLAGVVLAGYGHARLALAQVILTIVVQAVLLVVLIPPFGIVGAAIAVGASYSVQNVAQVIAVRQRTGAFTISSRAFAPLLPTAGGAIAAGAVLLAMRGQPELHVRIAAFIAFAIGYLALLWRDYRNGKLSMSAPPEGSGPGASALR